MSTLDDRHDSGPPAAANTTDGAAANLRWATASLWLALAGAILSGPVGLLVVGMTHPQPAWHDAATFVAHYHPIQTLPFFLGFLLVGGLVAATACLSLLARPQARARATVAAALASAFSALVFLNYVVQTTFVPALVRDHSPASAPLIAALTMSNPSSLGWCLEMWAYAIAGVATWLCAAVFDQAGIDRLARATFVANGPVSLASAVATTFVPGWVLTSVGLVAFGIWNLLVVVMCGAALLALRARGSAGAPALGDRRKP
ncbi:MAG TPA: hypothetical protein VGQ57_13750 [Polyangiaceae bacterium]|jgi:hypothetical protein|nr:hypothetical protein [Polyangiaceae bacterium]